MGNPVPGDLKNSITKKLFELGQQVYASRGYPYDPALLDFHLQEAVEGRLLLPRVHQSVSKPVPDFTVHVNRRAKSVRPSWSRGFMRPDLQRKGPAEYNLKLDVEQRFFYDQKTAAVKNEVFYKHLVADNILANLFGLADLLAIQEMGTSVFRAIFRDKFIFGWKSVVRHHDDLGQLFVPSLHVFNRRVVLEWDGLFNTSSGPHTPVCCFRETN